MLHAEGICKTYGNGTVALVGLSFSVSQGEFVAIIGKSGCGKSSLLRLIAGLNLPDSGTLVIDDLPVQQPRPSVGVVFQEPRLLPWLRVEDNVAFGLGGLAPLERTRRINECLTRVGLAGYNRRWPRELSGGQAQRVAIARAIAPKPRMLLLDEPLSALDAFTRQGLQQHLADLSRELGLTFVLATHDIDEAVLLADRIIVMAPFPGRIADSHIISLKRPRRSESAEFAAAKALVLSSLRSAG